MHAFATPRITIQHRGQFDGTHWHSILISLLRGLAALIVAMAHLRAEMYPAIREVADPPLWFQGLVFISGFAHQAVLVFFVISGWLVGGSLLNRLGEPYAIAAYALDRVTRLWTVLVPTFGVTLLIAFGIGSIGFEDIDLSAGNPHSALTFAANLIGLQGIVVPDFGENFPLWSLANETWYYVLFPLLAVAVTTPDKSVRVSCLVAVPLLGAMLPITIVAYFSVWLLGVAFSRIRIDCGNALRWVCLALAIAAAVYARLSGEPAFEMSTLGRDLVCSMLYLALLCSLQFPAPADSRLAKPLGTGGKFFAEFSFSLYVLHVPVIGLLHHWSTTRLGLGQLSPSDPVHTVLFFAMLTVLVATAYLSYLLFESHTYRIRSALKKRFLRHDVPARTGCALSPER